ncbi:MULTISPECIES: hypothetical protein [unclassified Pseudomonas]|nr:MULTISPECIES: hypothetical protein [unclassified Pseudomonas]
MSLKRPLDADSIIVLVRAAQAANAKAGRKAQRKLRLRTLQRRAFQDNAR